MNKEQLIKEAARKYAEEQNSCFCNDYDGFYYGAKSEAAKNYWEFSALVEALKHGRVQELQDEVKALKFERDNSRIKTDAPDFAKWIGQNISSNSLKYYEDTKEWCYFESAHGKRVTEQQLYEIFKKLD